MIDRKSAMHATIVLLLWLMLTLRASHVDAQRQVGVFDVARPVTVEPQPRGTRAFAIEAAGGVAGSLIGLSAGFLPAGDCAIEDVGCYIEASFGALILGTIGSVAGTFIAGRLGETQPSLLGAAVGSVVGAAAGLGMWNLFTDQLDLVNNTAIAVATLGVTQGIVTAVGSRVGRALR